MHIMCTFPWTPFLSSDVPGCRLAGSATKACRDKWRHCQQATPWLPSEQLTSMPAESVFSKINGPEAQRLYHALAQEQQCIEYHGVQWPQVMPHQRTAVLQACGPPWCGGGEVAACSLAPAADIDVDGRVMDNGQSRLGATPWRQIFGCCLC